MQLHKPCTVSTSHARVYGRSLCSIHLSSTPLRSCNNGHCKRQLSQQPLEHSRIAATAEGGNDSGDDSGNVHNGGGRGNNGLHHRCVIANNVDATPITVQPQHPCHQGTKATSASTPVGQQPVSVAEHLSLPSSRQQEILNTWHAPLPAAPCLTKPAGTSQETMVTNLQWQAAAGSALQ